MAEALAVELLFPTIGERTKTNLQRVELSRTQAARPLRLGGMAQSRESLHDLRQEDEAVLRHRGLKSESSMSSSRSHPIWAAASSSGIDGCGSARRWRAIS